MNKKDFIETEIRTKYITPAIVKAGWDVMRQISEEKHFTDGKIFVRGQMVSRGEGKKADYLLFYEPNILLAVVEAKDNHHEIDGGLQQALGYAEILDAPFVLSSNGDGFAFHGRTATYERQNRRGRRLHRGSGLQPEGLRPACRLAFSWLFELLPRNQPQGARPGVKRDNGFVLYDFVSRLGDEDETDQKIVSLPAF